MPYKRNQKVEYRNKNGTFETAHIEFPSTLEEYSYVMSNGETVHEYDIIRVLDEKRSPCPYQKGDFIQYAGGSGIIQVADRLLNVIRLEDGKLIRFKDVLRVLPTGDPGIVGMYDELHEALFELNKKRMLEHMIDVALDKGDRELFDQLTGGSLDVRPDEGIKRVEAESRETGEPSGIHGC